MKSPKDTIRTTLGDEIPAVSGVYILAYMRKIVYVGMTTDFMSSRLASHISQCHKSRVGVWMVALQDDWKNVRLDVLVPPDECEQKSWLLEVEEACIRKFTPLFNELLND